MRILFTLHNFLPEPIYGAERICLLQMKHFLKAGHTVGLFYAGKEDAEPEVLEKEGLKDLHLFRINYFKNKSQVLLSIWKPHVSARFNRIIKSFRPDVVFFHHFVQLSLNLPSITRKQNIPSVYYLHDYYPVCPSYSLFDSTKEICREHSPSKCIRCLYESFFNRKLPSLLLPAFLPLMIVRKILIDRLSNDINLFISPTQSLLAELERQAFPLSRTVIIPHGCDTSNVTQPYKPHAPVRFGYIGNMHRKKGIHVLIDAFKESLSRSLIIRGFPDQYAINKFKSDNPSFEAQLEQFDPDITGFFNKIDMLVVPSIWIENQPTVILEAFSFGKPVLCSRIGGIEELVKQGSGGILFIPGDSSDLRRKIMHLTKHPEELSELASRIPALPTPEEYARSVMTALEDLLKDRTGKS
ncbi:MAG: glycosyltransferase [Kiritimatiellae bacterium]|nr:glycosyltransferase [Kiritimatiellia bacterium]MDD5521704.1 glycosyltransferase [Kiritimatiellia bacterium]